jgi:mycothiol synthase
MFAELEVTKLEVTSGFTADYTLRPATLADATAVSDLCNLCAIELTGAPEIAPEEVANDWQTPGFTPAESARLAVTPAGDVVGMVKVWDINPIPVNNYVFGRVHPAHTGRGIGSRMLAWAEETLQRTLTRVPADARVVMRASALSTHAPSQALLAGSGMQVVRHFWRMAMDLKAQPAQSVWPDGIVLRTFGEVDDLTAVYHAIEDSFADHWGYVAQPEAEGLKRWRHWIETDKHFDPSLWLLAMAGAEIAGASLCRSSAYDDPQMGWVNTLGVRRGWRRQGLGLALLQQSFGEFYRRGKARAGLGVDATSLTGATRLYEKAGMHVARQYITYEKELQPGRDLSKQALDE